MAKPEWGTKRTCAACGARFYDFARSPITCPSCGAVLDLETVARTRRSRPASRSIALDKKAIAPVPAHLIDDDDAPEKPEDESEDEQADEMEVAEDDEEEAVVEDAGDDQDEDVLIEDASDLGDDDVVSDVIDSDDEDEAR